MSHASQTKHRVFTLWFHEELYGTYPTLDEARAARLDLCRLMDISPYQTPIVYQSVPARILV